MTKTAASKQCGCRGKSGEIKRKFGSRRSAVAAAFQMRGFPRPYRCPKVKGRWHLTHF